MRIRDRKDVLLLGTILTVYAHPDDETFCAGGLLAAAIENGQKVVCITATRGEAGSQDAGRWPSDKLADIREQELQEAFAVLGVGNYHQLGYADGGCCDVPKDEAVSQLISLVKMHNPDTILSFGPDGLTGHPDHKAVSGWVEDVVRVNDSLSLYQAVLTTGQYSDYLKEANDRLNIFYNIEQPPLVEEGDCDIAFFCDDVLKQCKFDAFNVMPSQFEVMKNVLGEEFIKEAFNVEAFRRVYL